MGFQLAFNHMVEYSAAELDLIFHALADQTRRAILEKLSKQRLTISETAKPFRMSLAAVSKHLKVLERAKLIEREKQGSFYIMRLNTEALLGAEEWLHHYRIFWDDRLESLKQRLEDE